MRFLILILFFVDAIFCKADENLCKNALYNANKLYENGYFQEAINTLQPCILSNNLNREEKFDATRLVALCYVYLGDKKNAEIYIEKILRLRPDYQKYPYVDPAEFRNILKGFMVNNKLDIGIEIGYSQNQVRIIKNFSTANTQSTYKSKAGITVAILGEYHFSPQHSILFRPNYNSINYRRIMDNVAGSKKEYSELMLNVEIPVSYRIYFGNRKWHFYGQAGFQWDYMIKSFADVQSTNLSNGTVFQSSTETTPYRRRSFYGFNAGLGVSKPMGKGTLSLGLSYKYFISNFAVPDKRYDNVDFILSSQYIDSDFSINSLNLNISYQLPFMYRVKKKNIL